MGGGGEGATLAMGRRQRLERL